VEKTVLEYSATASTSHYPVKNEFKKEKKRVFSYFSENTDFSNKVVMWCI